MFIEAKDDGGGGYNWSYKSHKAPVKSSPPTNQHPVFLQAGCPSCCPTNSVIALNGKNIAFHGPAYPKLTWGLPSLSLTTNSSWLPWGRVAMPLISPLMPVPQHNSRKHQHKKLKQFVTFCKPETTNRQEINRRNKLSTRHVVGKTRG